MLQKRLAKVGIAKQAAKGAVAASAAYDFGVTGGSVVQADVTEDDLNPTAASRVLEGVDRTFVVPGAGFDMIAMPGSIGLLLAGATGSTVTAGVGPFTHTFTPAADDVPYLTLFARYAADYLQVPDCKIDELELEFDGVGAVRAKVKVMGLNLVFLGAAYTVDANGDERVVGGNKLSTAGGALTIDGLAARITKGSIKIVNKLTAVQVATSVTPDELFPGQCEVTVSLTVLPDNLALWRKHLTGADAGNAISKAPFEGAIALEFLGVAPDALDFSAPRCAIALGMPEASPEGGPAEFAVEAKVLTPAAGAAYTFTLTNDVAAY